MSRRLAAVALAAPLLLAAAPSDDATLAQRCSAAGFAPAQLEGRIAACTDLIATGLTGGLLRQAHDDRGMAYMAARRYDDALADFDAALAVLPSAAEPSYAELTIETHRGTAQFWRGRYFLALADLDPVIAQTEEPTLKAEALYMRAAVETQLSLPARALADLAMPIALQPLMPRGYVVRGIAYWQLADLPHAIADFDRALALYPGMSSAMVDRGRAYADEGRYAEAIADYEAALKLEPDAGGAAKSLEEAEAALAAEEARIAASPAYAAPAPNPAGVVPALPTGRSHDCTAAYPSLSRRLDEQGSVTLRYDVDAKGAIGNVTLLQTSGFDRLDRAALACVANLWRSQPAQSAGQPIASPNHVARVDFYIQPSTDAAEGALSTAAGWAIVGDYDKALAAAERAMAKPDSDAYYSRGLIRYAAGDLDGATADFTKYKALKPGEPFGPDALVLMTKLKALRDAKAARRGGSAI
jgi:TonB family protein